MPQEVWVPLLIVIIIMGDQSARPVDLSCLFPRHQRRSRVRANVHTASNGHLISAVIILRIMQTKEFIIIIIIVSPPPLFVADNLKVACCYQCFFICYNY